MNINTLGPDDTTQQARPPPKPDNERITRPTLAAFLPQYVSFPNVRRNGASSPIVIVSHPGGKADENSGGPTEPFTSTVKQVLRVFNHWLSKSRRLLQKVCFVIHSLPRG